MMCYNMLQILKLKNMKQRGVLFMLNKVLTDSVLKKEGSEKK